MANMASIYKRKNGLARPKWYVKYRDAQGRVRRVSAGYDKSLALAKAHELERRVEREKAGLCCPADDAAREPLEKHLAAFEAALKARGRTREHVVRTVARIQRALAGCNRVGDITPARVQAVLAEMRAHGAGATTLNNYLVAAKAFAIWLVRNRRAPDNPLAGLSRYNAAADRRHVRRALEVEELSRLLEATAKDPKTVHGLDGPARATLYLTAAFTGLRAGELASLTPTSFALDAEPPIVTVKAMYSKHRREDRLPLHPELVVTLRGFLTPRSPFEPVWPGAWRPLAAPMLRDDLEAAGVPVEVDGRVADFHALRVTFITGLSRAGVHPRTAMELARHGSIGLTMSTYTRLELHDTAAAVAKLPNLSPFPDSAAATGTAGNSRESACAPICAHSADISDDSLESRGKGTPRKEETGAAPNARTWKPLESAATGKEGATRGGFEPPMREPKSLVLPVTPPGSGPYSTTRSRARPRGASASQRPSFERARSSISWSAG